MQDKITSKTILAVLIFFAVIILTNYIGNLIVK